MSSQKRKGSPDNVSGAAANHTVLRIAIFVPLLNSGETTRGVELAKGLRSVATQRDDIDLDLKFFTAIFSPLGTEINYEDLVEQEGFAVERIGSGLDRKQWTAMLEHEHAGSEIFDRDEKDRAVNMLRLSVEALKKYQPTIVLHGTSPDGSLAAKILGLPNVRFASIPLTKVWTKERMLKDMPDFDKNFVTSLLPKWLRRTLVRYNYFRTDIPGAIAQPTLRAAAIECGWEVTGDGNLIDMLSAKEKLILDLPGNYKDDQLPSNSFVTGPIFAHVDDQTDSLPEIPTEITTILAPENPNKVFMSMGSSGEKKYLFEAIKALCSNDFHAVIIVPPTICSVTEVRSHVGDALKSSKVYLTDAFEQAIIVNRMADVAIVHGGQGTVQTAMASGTPIVGIAFQGEQQFNLDCVVKRGAGIRLCKSRWDARHISKALHQVLGDPTYKEAANAIRAEMEAIDGRAIAVERIINFAMRMAVDNVN